MNIKSWGPVVVIHGHCVKCGKYGRLDMKRFCKECDKALDCQYYDKDTGNCKRPAGYVSDTPRDIPCSSLSCTGVV